MKDTGDMDGFEVLIFTLGFYCVVFGAIGLGGMVIGELALWLVR